jgi:hypothetical protein
MYDAQPVTGTLPALNPLPAALIGAEDGAL